jgi:hypothetical protein
MHGNTTYFTLFGAPWSAENAANDLFYEVSSTLTELCKTELRSLASCEIKGGEMWESESFDRELREKDVQDCML